MHDRTIFVEPPSSMRFSIALRSRISGGRLMVSVIPLG